MTITFYDGTTAPSPRRACILLAEKGVAHAAVNLDLAGGEQMGAAYRTINPLCTVPALQLEDGRVLIDNAAIAAYLEARFPEPPLLGTTQRRGATSRSASVYRLRECRPQMECVARTALVVIATAKTGNNTARRAPTAPTAKPMISEPSGPPPSVARASTAITRA